MSIRMIVTDLDRTLLRSDRSVSDYTASVLNRCKESGTKVVFATARPARSTKRFQDKLIADYIIANTGATVSCGETVIRNLLIPSSTRDELMARFLACKEVMLITLEAGDRLLTNYDGPPWEVGWDIVYTDFTDGVYPDTPKLSVECEDVSFLIDIIRDYPALHFYSNSGERWHQIMCKEATKTAAISHIAASLGFGLESVVAFGDDYSDVEMLQRCGIGVAVANAIGEAKTAARHTCDANDNDGVAKWLEEHVLFEQRGKQ